MKRVPPTRPALATLSLALCVALAATPASANIRPKNGFYMQAAGGKKAGYISTKNGKVTAAGGNVAFRKKGVGRCTPDGLVSDKGITVVFFRPPHPVKPRQDNRFSFNGKKNKDLPELKSSITGRFLSRKKARFTIKLRQGNCRASLNLTKAEFTLGG